MTCYLVLVTACKHGVYGCASNSIEIGPQSHRVWRSIAWRLAPKVNEFVSQVQMSMKTLPLTILMAPIITRYLFAQE